jgi:2-amino-4-hydroxy-6-hydroxymethyldihydropteridine diphosphokinase
MILVALGANLSGPWGGPEEGLVHALGQFPSYGLHLDAFSAIYRTPAVTPYAQPDFMNAVARVSCAFSPDELLAQLHRIEAAFGRVRGQRWQERTLDLDLLDFDGLVWPENGSNHLVLPHPRLSVRGFVLVPLAELAPDWRHPISGETAKEMLKSLPIGEKQGIVRLP